MELPTLNVGISASTLEIELHPPEGAEQTSVSVRDFTEQLNALGWLGGAVQSQATTESWREVPFEERVNQVQPELIRAHFGSPLSLLLGFHEQIAADISAAALLIFGLKRFWAIDLEVRAHREEQRTRFYEAQKKASLAEEELRKVMVDHETDLQARLGEFLPDSANQEWERAEKEYTENCKKIARDQGWNAAVIEGMLKMKPRRPWRNGEGVWQIDD